MNEHNITSWYNTNKIKKSNMISYNVIGHNKTLPVIIDTLQSTAYFKYLLYNMLV